jgi:hypothetical protein
MAQLQPAAQATLVAESVGAHLGSETCRALLEGGVHELRGALQAARNPVADRGKAGLGRIEVDAATRALEIGAA